MPNLNMPIIEMTLGIVVYSFDDVGLTMTDEPISIDDMTCVVEQFKAMKKGWA